ncbi:ADP-ribosyl cyclase/cyclic ADP-ribose hydrolase-like [Ostrea edulis]|uniref:ADP-ribosyl cyclase/cyclic ADP-ribose hydrolase-like n=1 Tax=Ostrea edulis TaxID=37623 RepID=UPI0024AFF78E|nr:ADP-ribosyl cyclase/cyclic ADP-ribose hydrolase-like [Ostrea edulis]
MISWALLVAFLPLVMTLSPAGKEFVGKCLYYQTTINPEPFKNRMKNCSELWESFREAIAFQSLCHVDRQRFVQFINDSQHDVPQSKFIFWEHVYDTVMKYSYRGKRTFSIADTLTGFLGDTKFCGSNSSADGVEQDRSKCPGYDQTPSCPSSAEAAFWSTSSEYFSRSAHGEVELMLNASSPAPITNESYFSRWELPNLRAPRVTGVRVLFAHNTALPPRETCSGPSVQLVKNVLNTNGVTKVTCEVNPSSLRFQLCSESPGLPICNTCDTNGTSTLYRQQISFILIAFFIYMF